MFSTAQKGIRAGIIPFTICKKRLFFLLGVDRKTRELTDFGGGIKSSETIEEGALRELHEESCYIFENEVTKEKLNDTLSIANIRGDIVIFFIYIPSKWLKGIEQMFLEKQSYFKDIKKYNELKGVKWVDQDDFKIIAFNQKCPYMWKKIQNVLRWNITWHDLKTGLIKNAIL